MDIKFLWNIDLTYFPWATITVTSNLVNPYENLRLHQPYKFSCYVWLLTSKAMLDNRQEAFCASLKFYAICLKVRLINLLNVLQ